MNQLIANVSIVPKVRQLMAFRIDLACVSAPRKLKRAIPDPTATPWISPHFAAFTDSAMDRAPEPRHLAPTG